MKEVVYKPMNMNDGVIVQYSDSFVLDKSMKDYRSESVRSRRFH